MDSSVIMILTPENQEKIGGREWGLPLLTVLLLVFAGGCAGLDYSAFDNRRDREAKIEKLVAAREYDAALALLDETAGAGEGGGSDRLRRREVARLSDEFSARAEQRAAELVGQDDLFGAITLVDEALRNVPGNARLRSLSAQLKEERDRRLADNARQMLAGEAEYLYSRLQGYREQAVLEKLSIWTRWRMDKAEKSLAALLPALLACGRQAAGLEDYEIAERCLTMAGKIDDSGQAPRLLAELEEKPAGEEEGAGGENHRGGDAGLVYIVEANKVKPAAAVSASFLELEGKLEAEIEKGELVKASETLAELEKFSNRSERLAQCRQRLDGVREQKITLQMEKGSELYRLGRIREARTVWRQVLLLDPDHRAAREKIDRADKVLASISDLQKAQKK